MLPVEEIDRPLHDLAGTEPRQRLKLPELLRTFFIQPRIDSHSTMPSLSEWDQSRMYDSVIQAGRSGEATSLWRKEHRGLPRICATSIHVA